MSARLELDEAGRHAYRYVVLRDADSLALLFAEYSYDDRFFENGVLKVGSDLELSLQATCEFSAPCYQEAVRFELVDPTRSLRAGEFESTDFQIEANDYTFYVTGARSQTGFVANGECPAGHYTPGFQIFFDVLAH